MSVPNGLWRTVVADPPWQPDLGASWNSSLSDKARPQRFYPTMSVAEIAAIPVVTARQAHLYLWCIAQHVDWGYQVCRAWGFDPVILWTWKKPGLGAGRFRCNTEHVLVGRKGSRHGNPFGLGGRHVQATDGTCFEWPRGRHSEKPREFFELVERLSPEQRLELFARQPRSGWTCWGNELSPAVTTEPTGEGAEREGGQAQRFLGNCAFCNCFLRTPGPGHSSNCPLYRPITGPEEAELEGGQAQGWQPIATAPKDGTEILLTDGHYKRTGWWASRIGRWSIDAVVSLEMPTHWVPLPAPPQE